MCRLASTNSPTWIITIFIASKTKIHKEFHETNFQCYFRKFYYPADAYNKSKLAQVLFTKSLEKIFAEHGLKIQSHSLHPGVVNTDLFEHSSTDYVPWIRKLFFKVCVFKMSLL